MAEGANRLAEFLVLFGEWRQGHVSASIGDRRLGGGRGYDGQGLGFVAFGFVPGGQHVGARRDVRDLETAGAVGDREVGMFQHIGRGAIYRIKRIRAVFHVPA